MQGAGYGMRDVGCGCEVRGAGSQLFVYFVAGCWFLLILSSSLIKILNPKSLKLKTPKLATRISLHSNSPAPFIISNYNS